MLVSRKSPKEQLKNVYATPILGSEASDEPIPQFSLPENPLDPEIAYQLIKDDLIDEGNARQNLATFCQSYMEPEAVKIMAETLEKNAIDKSEYPQTADLESRCVNIIADLWNASKGDDFIGTSTVGSSEACMLGGMAMKFAWRKRAEAKGMDIYTKKPNLVISSGYQVCWEKFCVYWDIEMRLVPLDEKHMSLNLDLVLDCVDDYTIGVVAIMGITYTGKYDDVEGLDQILEEYNKSHDLPVYIHVDGASGGMFAPFIHPDLKWDFRLKNVVSINTSGHKYGLVYPGVGWILWKDKKYLPSELIFNVSYLGGSMPTMAINFSRSASQIIGQYFNFLRCGRQGYISIHQRTQDVAVYIGKEIKKTGLFEIFNDGKNIPIVCWKLKPEANKEWSLYDLADRVRMNGWQVPAYPLPDNLTDVIIQRVVVRQDLNMQIAIQFINDFKHAIQELDSAHILIHGKATENKGPSGFTH
ncbi:glutamate decarboxylase [Acetobacterium sp.]|uniref:glutamate decarboxylase n=1 Tax=Acetobacterium sp. TaxID=1872094 RepID=UPI000CC5B62B|nr:glutamate decarboxylase [Acetobacterium sp.]MDO9490617.1 glutamate decarboxylase [Acetobacterium sp.]PKM74790.1 MAG: glutamate decarboxylase [Firmicutes bacterium HGW-Firmicutes-17]